MKRHSADRTRSWRQRAGSRRNKRLRNVGTHTRELGGCYTVPCPPWETFP